MADGRDGDGKVSSVAETTVATGAESLLVGLRAAGIDWLFANSGTDFPPIIEAYASLPAQEVPVPVTIPHETAAIGMAHGYWLATGRMQAVMVHVNVGLANTAMGVINARSDDIPMLVMSGRTPITETGHSGSRMTPIQYGQEMFDQSSLVADSVKWHYEMRYPEQGAGLVSRAAAIARSAPAGPVYLSLPREPLTEAVEPPAPVPRAQAAATLPWPDPDAIATLAGWLAEAEAPVILIQRGDPAGNVAAALDQLARTHGIAVAEPFSIRNVLPSDHPCLIGYDAKAATTGADLVVVIDSGVPWIAATQAPSADARIVHIGCDPLIGRMPVRGYRSDLSLTGDPAAVLRALLSAMGDPAPQAAVRTDSLAAKSRARREAIHDKARATATDNPDAPMSAEWLSLCLTEAIGPEALVFSELGVLPGAMNLSGPNRLFNNPHSGGLGWALPAALGAQLSDRERLVVACVGDGSYIFANPVACHQIAEAMELPVLTIVKNNAMWNAVRRSVVNAYPDGAAVSRNKMPLVSLEPLPDLLAAASGSRAHVERVMRPTDLPGALDRAIGVIRDERRQAVLDVRVEISDKA
ncbi:thiamine pyrophosphate-requiring protein [Paracoccus sp. TK19116]|uniref:Thiamine pyrophosphate-requiring protein n=1 Tax=Paracoccus albicereus TaxID=2922394 RepID=A0ABT1MS47_9RHOB|nr:thiamine pyrophosphate-requiring protein [Paracoccus albicereus]MCQ0971113.1 thiamine pyrophosphate-requiring protein [Paracoccus albicereus]